MLAFLPQQLFEIGDGLRQALPQLNPRRLGEMLLRRANVGAALLGVVFRKRPIHDLGHKDPVSTITSLSVIKFLRQRARQMKGGSGSFD